MLSSGRKYIQIFVWGANDLLMAHDFPIPGTKPWPKTTLASYDDATNNRGSLKYYSALIVENTKIAAPIVLNLYTSCRGADMNFFMSRWDMDPRGTKHT
jgi:hypothetical protein